MKHAMILAAAILAGCATTEPDPLPGQIAALNEACQKQLQPQASDAYQQHAFCTNSGLTRLRAAHDYPYPDLAALEDNYRVLVAQQRDAGAIGDAQVGVYMAELNTRIASEEQARMGQAAAAESQRRQANAANWAAISQGLALMS